MSTDKHIYLLAIKMLNFYTILMRQLIIFFTQLFFSVQYLFSTSVTTSHQFKSSVTVFKKKLYKWYLTKRFLFSHVRVPCPLHQIIYFR